MHDRAGSNEDLLSLMVEVAKAQAELDALIAEHQALVDEWKEINGKR